MKKNYLIIPLALLVIAVAIYHKPFVWTTEKLQKAYRGDGIIKFLGRFGTGNGYMINFESFLLNEGFDQTFNIKKVPKLGRNVGVHLKIFMDKNSYDHFQFDELNKSIMESTIEIRVQDANKKDVLNIIAPIRDFKFSHYEYEQYEHVFLYYLSQETGLSSQIDKDLWEKGNFIIKVNFSPLERGFPKGTKAAFFVACGGFH